MCRLSSRFALFLDVLANVESWLTDTSWWEVGVKARHQKVVAQISTSAPQKPGEGGAGGAYGASAKRGKILFSIDPPFI